MKVRAKISSLILIFSLSSIFFYILSRAGRRGVEEICGAYKDFLTLLFEITRTKRAILSL